MTDKIKVLEVLEATTGGTRRHLVDLATHLDRDRFSVSVICSTLRDKAFLADIEAMKKRGIEVTVIQMVRQICPARDIAAFIAIYRRMKRGNYSVVHTHSSKAGFLGRLAARTARVPLVIHTPHAFPFEMHVGRTKKAFYFRLERFAARFTDKIVCVCRNEKDAAIRKELASPDKFIVIENGIGADDPETADQRPIPASELRKELDIDTDAPIVGMVGRFTRQKGHQYLLRAAVRIVKQFPAVKFLLIGEGELKGKIQRLIESLSLQNNCIILGPHSPSPITHHPSPIPHHPFSNDISSFYSIIDILAMPSLWEGLPYVLLDGMAAGKAITATSVGGMTEAIVPEQNGMLVPAGDVEALAGAITRLLKSPELRAKLGAGAKETMKDRYRLKDMVERLEALYQGEG